MPSRPMITHETSQIPHTSLSFLSFIQQHLAAATASIWDGLFAYVDSSQSEASEADGGVLGYAKGVVPLVLEWDAARATTAARSLLFEKNGSPPPPKKSIHEAILTPKATAGSVSLLWFSWTTPLLSLGYARPPESPDLCKLQEERGASKIADVIVNSFAARQEKAAEYNERLAKGEIGPGLKGLWWSIRDVRAEREMQWREKDGKRKASLVLALNDSVFWWFWSAGILKVISDTAQITSPLVVKAIIELATESYTNNQCGQPTPPIGTGIGLSFGLLALQFVTSWGTH
ncbi:hypothetical protein AZE42_10287 [Rhizopogon vesiculosus]|uniref:Uncharacterized protein n=1 Tax=Rhizopogon vesiculosus TaxID=180088 RepID=A0A1J8PV02_9AGAM|nr:hypothetical protein AZE42_10287 [Rhizopogon vesiculosus]